jgi:hypothetical protein
LKLGTGDVLQVEDGPGGELVLRLPSRGEANAQIEKGYAWFRKTGRDLAQELQETRRRERQREQRRGP